MSFVIVFEIIIYKRVMSDNDYNEEEDGFEYAGLGRKKMTKNERIYGDFYEAYEENENKGIGKIFDSYYDNFKAG